MGRCLAACECSAWLCPGLTRRAEHCSQCKLYLLPLLTSFPWPNHRSLQAASSCNAKLTNWSRLCSHPRPAAASKVGRPLHRDWPTLCAAAGGDGATQIVHRQGRDRAPGWGDGKRDAAAGWDGVAAEGGLQPGWLLAGLVAGSPRVIKLLYFGLSV